MTLSENINSLEKAKFRENENKTVVAVSVEKLEKTAYSSEGIAFKFGDSSSVDSFGRLRVASPTTSVFDGQLTYDLQPLLYEQITTGVGASIVHDSTNNRALLTFASTPAGGECFMQTFDFFRYQPGKSQHAAITFNMGVGVGGVVKFAGYSDGVNGIEFIMNGLVPSIRILSSSSNGNTTIAQDDWNVDTMKGLGPSGITLDTSKAQILVLDFQALYTGRVRVGFNIAGIDYYVHHFNHANIISFPYIANANLPVRIGMTCSQESSTTMHYTCCSVTSEGGLDNTTGYHFSQEGSVTAANGVRTHALSIRHRQLFNSKPNRSRFVLESINGIVTGTDNVKYEICLGDSITGSTAYTNVNSTYSGMEYNTAGTTSGSPAIVFEGGYIPASNQSHGSLSTNIPMRYPMGLSRSGQNRLMGTVTVLVTGIGGASSVRFTLNWKEIR